MTTTTTDFLLEATDVAKTYGAVVALKAASLQVRPGEAHALMGANGAGKSTLVKILTGAIRPDSGTITVRDQIRTVHSPAEPNPTTTSPFRRSHRWDSLRAKHRRRAA